MMWNVADPNGEPDPVLAKALDVLFILHADHEQNCSTTTMRTVGSAEADPFIAVTAATCGLYGPLHGGANEKVIRMLHEIGSLENVPAYIERVKAGDVLLQGFGHRVYKNFDPRATIVKQTADSVFAVTGTNPLLDIALKLEEVALSDSYFIDRKLYPNVDFYSGLIYEAMGFPMDLHSPVRHWKGAGVACSLAGAAQRSRAEDLPPTPGLYRSRRARLRRHRQTLRPCRRGPGCGALTSPISQDLVVAMFGQ